MAGIREAVEHIITVIREPLEAKGACLSSIDDDLEECEGSREGFARIVATIDMESFLKMS